MYDAIGIDGANVIALTADAWARLNNAKKAKSKGVKIFPEPRFRNAAYLGEEVIAMIGALSAIREPIEVSERVWGLMRDWARCADFDVYLAFRDRGWIYNGFGDAFDDNGFRERIHRIGSPLRRLRDLIPAGPWFE
jgi:hypothetical protein